MARRPPTATRTDTLFPYATRCRSAGHLATAERAAGVDVACPIALEETELGSDVEVFLTGVAVVVVEVVARSGEGVTGQELLETDDEGSHLATAHRGTGNELGGGDAFDDAGLVEAVDSRLDVSGRSEEHTSELQSLMRIS